ncbi:MAG: redoxin domain-containing protein, partial [Planctomycetia bacterium]
MLNATPFPATADDKPTADPKADPKDAPVTKVQEGHAMAGEAFNVGPRGRARLMPGVGKVHFPASTKNTEAQAFFVQGVGQLHGFWYWEAERSFRQAAALDPELAIAYWGMSMANVATDEGRAKRLVAEAVKRKEKASPREQRYIDALDKYLNSEAKEKKRRRDWVTAWEGIVHDHPDDLEAKAFLVWLIWENSGEDVPFGSPEAVDALAKQVLAVEPMHPVHHYLIHLWDKEKAARALPSAAAAGPAAPAIAHMWHMPGHTYSKLDRWSDAAWQQEASARVDHASMNRDLVPPYVIHNYAHNSEWLVRNLIALGRCKEAAAVARNLCQIPRHPKYNDVKKDDGCAGFGRRRLIETLTAFEAWDELVAVLASPELRVPEDDARLQTERLLALGRAHFGKGDAKAGDDVRDRLAKLKTAQEAAKKTAGDAAETKVRNAAAMDPDDSKGAATVDAAVKKGRDDAERPFVDAMKAIDDAATEMDGLNLAAAGKPAEAVEKLAKAPGVPARRLARAYLAAGDKPKAEEQAGIAVKDAANAVLPLAVQVEVLHAVGKKNEAADAFAKLRTAAFSADLEVAPLKRLEPIVKELKLAAGTTDDWRQAPPPAADIGARPALDTLGPKFWTPPAAIDAPVAAADGASRRLADLRGKPTVLIFYLGYGCLHCAEQLGKFAEAKAGFDAVGIDLVGVADDEPGALRKSIDRLPEKFAFPLFSDAPLEAFRAYRSHDDFENRPLHATVLLDAAGRVRWWDVGHEPFTDPAFVLDEA